MAVASLTSTTSAVPTPEAIRNHPALKAQPEEVRQRVELLLESFDHRPRREYYLSKLQLALDTPYVPGNPTGLAQLQRDAARVQPPRTYAEARLQQVEELASATRPLEIITYQDRSGLPVQFEVDRRDVTNFHFRVKVHLKGDAELVAMVRKLEDAIEKHLATKGFTVDVVFLDHGGPGVFEPSVDPKRWQDWVNWVAGITTLAHENMHVFDVADEYDVVENHADNEALSIPERLEIFLDQPPPPDGEDGIMGDDEKKPLDRHVCLAAHVPVEPCVAKRQAAFRKAAGPRNAPTPEPLGPHRVADIVPPAPRLVRR